MCMLWRKKVCILEIQSVGRTVGNFRVTANTSKNSIVMLSYKNKRSFFRNWKNLLFPQPLKIIIVTEKNFTTIFVSKERQ